MMNKSRTLKMVAIVVPLWLIAIWSFGQAITVHGTAKDSEGLPLPGVSVMVQGTTQGTISDESGNYTLENVDPSATLVFSFVGMRTKQVNVDGQTELNVEMESEASALEEVVVVGYGIQRKEAVTGSVASVSGDVLREVESSNASQALQGRIPGVDIARNSTKPGATMQIRIRGTRSLTASNDPLVVLDGIPFGGSIGDINPADIKRIDILKDASATAIYGSRGANGVILVTTNQGYKGQQAQVSYNGYAGMKSVFAKYPMMEGPEFVKLRETAGIYTNGEDESDNTNTDWQDLLYRTGMVTNHNLGVSGGTEQGTYNFGAGYYKEEAVLPGQDYSRISIRGALDQGVGKYFRFGLTTYNNFSVSNGFNLGLYDVLSSTPIADPYNPDGTFRRTIRMPLDEHWVKTRETVDALGDRWIDQSKDFGSYNNLYGEVNIPGIEGLKYRINAGLTLRMGKNGQYTGEGVFSNNPTNPSQAIVSDSLTTAWTAENILTYDRVFNDVHRLNVVGLFSAEQIQFNRTHISAKDIPADALQFYNLGYAAGEVKLDPLEQNYWNSGLMSWMGRVMYSYADKYMLTASIRSDASSRLAEGHKWHTYPAVSAGWNISSESFLEDNSAIDLLKLRVGYGQTSNQSIDPYATLGLLGTRPYNFGPTSYSVGYYVTDLPNANLGWEYSITWNFGLDFALFGNRLSGILEYYITNTKDILLGVNLPNSSGVSSYTANIGETRNKGIEFSLNALIVDNPEGFSWEAGLNIFANRNELVALASGQERDEANWWFVGYPIDVIFDYEKTGLWQESDPYRDILEPGGNAGMIKVKYDGEFNPDGTPVRQIGADDRQIMSIEPNFLGGFNTRLAYKGLDLNIVGAFKSGGILTSSLYASNGYLNLMTGRRNNVKVDYWTPDNTDAKYPYPAGVLSGDNPKYGSTLGYFNASYLKIRDISLGYNFDRNNWIRNSGISRLRIYATVQNAFVMFSPYHKESGMDPETNTYANDRQNAAVPAAVERERFLTIGTNTPSTRNYLIGINITF